MDSVSLFWFDLLIFLIVGFIVLCCLMAPVEAERKEEKHRNARNDQ